VPRSYFGSVMAADSRVSPPPSLINLCLLALDTLMHINERLTFGLAHPQTPLVGGADEGQYYKITDRHGGANVSGGSGASKRGRAVFCLTGGGNGRGPYQTFRPDNVHYAQ
jgi:hypothetical protein